MLDATVAGGRRSGPRRAISTRIKAKRRSVPIDRAILRAIVIGVATRCSRDDTLTPLLGMKPRVFLRLDRRPATVRRDQLRRFRRVVRDRGPAGQRADLSRE